MQSDRRKFLNDFSAVSVCEVAMLVQKGRLNLAPDVHTWISENLKRPVELEPLSPAICIASSRLSEFHGDSADRLIVATAMTLGLPLMTADKKIIEWNKAHSAIQILNL
ncbi:MAG: type II toxin-antitoxin system VapC family toxin [bacterium]